MTVVLLPPIALGAASWDETSLSGLPVSRHEYAGYGPRAGEPAAADMHDLASDVLAHHPGHLDLVGISMGGMIAQHAALLDPKRVRSLVLLCTNPGGRPGTMLERAERVEQLGSTVDLEPTFERWFTAEALSADPELEIIAYARAALADLSARTLASGWRAIAGHDLRERLGEIRVPVTVVAARQDAASTPQRVHTLVDGLTSSRFIEVDGPHMLHMEEPRQVATVIRSHLDWIGDGRPISRLPIAVTDPQDELVQAVFARFAREGRPPIALYRTLATAPKMLHSYSILANALRNDADVPRALRELTILRTAQLTESHYEWSHHRLLARKDGLLTDAKIDALGDWADSPLFDERERCVLRCAEEIHHLALSEDAFAELERLFEPAQCVELVLVASFYQAVARVLQGLGVEVEPEYQRFIANGNSQSSGESATTDRA